MKLEHVYKEAAGKGTGEHTFSITLCCPNGPLIWEYPAGLSPRTEQARGLYKNDLDMGKTVGHFESALIRLRKVYTQGLIAQLIWAISECGPHLCLTHNKYTWVD